MDAREGLRCSFTSASQICQKYPERGLIVPVKRGVQTSIKTLLMRIDENSRCLTRTHLLYCFSELSLRADAVAFGASSNSYSQSSHWSQALTSGTGSVSPVHN